MLEAAGRPTGRARGGVRAAVSPPLSPRPRRTYTHPPHTHTPHTLLTYSPFETMLLEMRRLKQEYPNRVLIASVMEEVSR